MIAVRLLLKCDRMQKNHKKVDNSINISYICSIERRERAICTEGWKPRQGR